MSERPKRPKQSSPGRDRRRNDDASRPSPRPVAEAPSSKRASRREGPAGPRSRSPKRSPLTGAATPVRVPAASRIVRAPRDSSPTAMLALYRPDIAKALAELDCPSYRYAQVYEHLLHRPLHPFSEASALPADIRSRLGELGASTLQHVEQRTAPDGTTKLLLSGAEGARIETVLMRYRDRMTACISSQVGCAVGCLFCATGGMGFKRNLSAAEIVDQLRAASALVGTEQRRVSNVVFMGMGEPLLNLQAVLDSMRILTDRSGIGLSHRALSISTVGIPSGILHLARREPQVNLALSLHAPDDTTRSLLIPPRFRHPVSEILDAAWEHFALTRRKLMIEYVLLRGINDSPEQARALARLLRGHVVTVNLLSWNPVRHSIGSREETGGRARSSAHHGHAGQSEPRALAFLPSPPAAVTAFRETLLTSHIETVVRRSKGAEIEGACGQLAGRQQSETSASSQPANARPGAERDRLGRRRTPAPSDPEEASGEAQARRQLGPHSKGPRGKPASR